MPLSPLLNGVVLARTNFFPSNNKRARKVGRAVENGENVRESEGNFYIILYFSPVLPLNLIKIKKEFSLVKKGEKIS